MTKRDSPKGEHPWEPDGRRLLLEGRPAPKGLLEEESLGFGALIARIVVQGVIKPLFEIGGKVAEEGVKQLIGLQAALKKYGQHLSKCDARRDRLSLCSCGWSKVEDEFGLKTKAA